MGSASCRITDLMGKKIKSSTRFWFQGEFCVCLKKDLYITFFFSLLVSRLPFHVLPREKRTLEYRGQGQQRPETQVTANEADLCRSPQKRGTRTGARAFSRVSGESEILSACEGWNLDHQYSVGGSVFVLLPRASRTLKIRRRGRIRVIVLLFLISH
jgi:hypothetical protein